MIDYIKRENLPSCMGTDSDYSDGWDDCLLSIKDIPAADVRENVHAHWVKLDMHKGMEQYKCSACEQSAYVPERMGEPMYAFCPNCGAQILGEKDDI